MLDLETLGTNSYSPISAIGAVFFDWLTGELGPGFYQPIDITDYDHYSSDLFQIDYSTLNWWFRQSDAAIKSTFAQYNAKPIVESLLDFTKFMKLSEEFGAIRVWGNGSDFDNIILGNHYKSVHLDQPWGWSKNRCYRTMKDLVQVDCIREGTHHNAIDDAKHQARHLCLIKQELSRGLHHAL